MDRWQSREAVRLMAAQRGWQIQRLKIDDGCCEIRCTDAQGRRFKAKIDPETLAVLKLKQRDHQPKGGRDRDKDRHNDRHLDGAAPRGQTPSTQPHRSTCMSKPLFTLLASACALALPALAHSRELTLSAQLKNYGGDGAYLAAYLTDAKGAYVRTLWVAGGKAKYHKHLFDWNRLSAGDAKRLNGVTGASVGAGRSLKVTADLADALIDAGYEIRIDAAAEDMRDSPSEIRVPLSSGNAGKPQTGQRYIQSLTFQLP